MEANQEKQTGNSQSLEERLAKLEKVLAEHQHLGLDGSAKFDGETEFIGKEFLAKGPAAQKEFIPLRVGSLDNSDQQKSKQRSASLGVGVQGVKESVSEQIIGAIVAGKKYNEENIPSSWNKADYNKVNQIQFKLVHSPQNEVSDSGPSTNMRNSFLVSEVTPVFEATGGKISEGGNTLTDDKADFQQNKMVGCLAAIYYQGGLLEAYKVIRNTKNTITIDGNWQYPSGAYDYFIFGPVYLGSAERPFQRGYFSDDIRLGKGNSAGNGVCYIKWGKESPEGVITAQPGSLYLNMSGGANGTLFVKESGSGNTGWTPLVTPDYPDPPDPGDSLKSKNGSITVDNIPTGQSLGEITLDVSSSKIKPPIIFSSESWEGSGSSPTSRDVWARYDTYSVDGDGYLDEITLTTFNISGATATISISYQILGRE